MVHSCLLYPCSHHHRLRTTSVRVSAPEHFGEPNDTGSNLENLVHDLWDGSPKPLKEFPQEEAKDLIAEHLVSLVKRALKWFIVVLLAFSFVSDATFAVLKNKELLILSGLFIGVALADFLKELSLDFGESNTKVGLILFLSTSFLELLPFHAKLVLAFKLAVCKGFRVYETRHCYWMLLHFCQGHITSFQYTRTAASFPYQQWWLDASRMVLAKVLQQTEHVGYQDEQTLDAP